MAESIMLDKAKDFAVEIINMCKSIKETRRESVLTNQLMRSGTSIGANLQASKTFTDSIIYKVIRSRITEA